MKQESRPQSAMKICRFFKHLRRMLGISAFLSSTGKQTISFVSFACPGVPWVVKGFDLV